MLQKRFLFDRAFFGTLCIKMKVAYSNEMKWFVTQSTEFWPKLEVEVP